MPRPGGLDRGIYEEKKPCQPCGGQRGNTKCKKCKGEGRIGTGVWWIEYKDAQGKRRRERIGPKSLAREIYSKRKTAARREEEFPAPDRTRVPTVREAAQAYLTGLGANKRSWRDDRHFAEIWDDVMGDRPLDQVLPSELETLKQDWREKHAPSTVNHRLNFLRRLYSVALADGIVSASPFVHVKLLAEDHSRVRWLSDEMEDRLRSVFESAAVVTVPSSGRGRPARKTQLDPRDWEIIEFAYLTGLRQGDQFWLRREQIDWATCVATIVMGKTRNRQRVVHVHLNARAQEIIHGRLAGHDSEWVFIGANGARLDAHNWTTRVFRPALAAAGIEDFCFRDLRHTTATRLRLDAGADIADIADALGHSGLDMVRRYAHVSDQHRKELMGKLERSRKPSDVRNTGTDGTPT